MYYVINKGIVTNTIELYGPSKEEYEKLEQVILVDAAEAPAVKVGDFYDEKNKRFAREGEDVMSVNARIIRDSLLTRSDYVMVADYPCSQSERDQWVTYRQALRDIPAQEGFPNNVVWPVPPTHEKDTKTLLQENKETQQAVEVLAKGR